MPSVAVQQTNGLASDQARHERRGAAIGFSRQQYCDILSAPHSLGYQTIPRNDFHNSITLRHLRIIAALADLKLVARVSESLNVTQPAVSKQIAELEKIVGVPVVTRDRNRLYLTPIGNRLADHAKQVLSQIDRASFDIDAMASGVTGSVSIGAVSSVAPTLLPKTIELFKRGAPHASVSVTEGHFVELLPMLKSGALDLLIARIWQPQELEGVDQMTLFSEPVIVVAGRDHPLTMQENLSWSDTIQFPWIFPQANSVARRAVDALFAANGLAPPSNTIASVSLALNLELFRAMPTLGFMPQRLAQAHSIRGDVSVLPLDTRGMLSEAHCFWRDDNMAQNGTPSLFLKCLQQTIEELKTIPFG